jgi:hypothetical protein
MNDNRKLIEATKAIMAYRDCTFEQAVAILEQDEWIDVSCAYNDGQQDALDDASAVIRKMFNEAKEQAEAEHKRAISKNPFFNE